MLTKYKPEIKICGITNLDDARAACDAGADYLGFVLFNKSPRAISPDALRRIREKLDKNTKCVGVFVNEPPLAVAKTAKNCGLDIVQLCGDESYNEFRSFPMPIWRVIRIQNGLIQPLPSKWPARPPAAPGAQRLRAGSAIRRGVIAGGPADRYVLDTAHEGKYGGTGKTVNWSIAARIAKEHKIMLAGGLTQNNVATALRIVRPFGIDVSSGVECRRGKKDHEKLRFFIEVVKKACNDFPKK